MYRVDIVGLYSKWGYIRIIYGDHIGLFAVGAGSPTIPAFPNT